ncbi:MAG: MoxR family ATPase [Phycisphaerae bacterium]
MEPKITTPERLLEQLGKVRQRLLEQIHKTIIGQDDVIELMLISLLARGHCLLMGVPGLAKTLLVQTIAKVLDLKFNRIQFTPDLMPSDITGTEIIEEDRSTGQRSFKFVKGPVFANILLADEINRTPPKTQAALLQSMQEYQVTAAGQTYNLDLPFFVLATQNPIEQEGTYPLPEAQLDRFMFMIKVDYPQREQEMAIVKRTTSEQTLTVEPVLSGTDVLGLQKMLRKVPVSDHVIRYAIDLVRASRPDRPESLDFINDWLSWGAGPRAGQFLVLGAKGRAMLQGRFNVSCEDIRAIAHTVLRHRIFPNFNADAEGIEADKIVDRLISAVAEHQT